eukprot:Protomagalhaensia_sp_Gyna_25__4732@NODE_463_length_3372_cov_36_305731_g358_i0_p1_GENE_NODE_463_length_3372_cov_36_305731_g358_i0NODE_463_length_3372_cov_36_305731_g358_i0_p1_ORF_typecomplete_len453_score72_28Ku/PF02735_16/4_3e33Ku_C/PF03730_14/1_1e04Ku_C/PF03730_14/1_5e09_NODE_463_length_3372_cov_36_305731_g358_i07562114
MLFTRRGDPCEYLPKDRPVAMQLGLDLVSNQVVLDVLPLAVGSERVDVSKFYGSLLDESAKQRLNNLFEEKVSDSAKQASGGSQQTLSMLKELQSELKRRAVRQRILQKIHLTIFPGVQVGLAIFSLVSEAVKSRPVLIRASDQRPVYAQTTWINNDTGELLGFAEIRKYYDIGGERVILTPEEVTKIKVQLARPGFDGFKDGTLPPDSRMMLLGFKPIALLDRHRYALKMQVYYAFPVDAAIEGSGVLMRALVEAMTSLQQVALLVWQYRNTSNFRIYVGVPQSDDRGHGMMLLPLPFEDDLRDPKAADADVSKDHANKIAEEFGEDAFAKILEAVDLGEDFAVEGIPNPALAHHYQVLEALALGEPDVQPAVDATVPESDLFLPLESNLKDLFDKLELGSPKPKKRPVSATRSAAASGSQVDDTQLRASNIHEWDKVYLYTPRPFVTPTS